MDKKYSVFILDMDMSDDKLVRKTQQLEDLLNEGYSILRCDSVSVATSGGGQSSYHSNRKGTLVYILQNLRPNGNQ